MMRIVALALGSLVLPGCTMGSTSLVKQLANDPATVYVHLSTPWGPQRFFRANPAGGTVKMSPDGSVTIEAVK